MTFDSLIEKAEMGALSKLKEKYGHCPHECDVALQAIREYERLRVVATPPTLLKKLEAIEGVLCPIADMDWLGKWRIQRALEHVAIARGHVEAAIAETAGNYDGVEAAPTPHSGQVGNAVASVDDVERVAKAVFDHGQSSKYPNERPKWEWLSDGIKERRRENAKTAIAAYTRREPAEPRRIKDEA